MIYLITIHKSTRNFNLAS